MSDYRHPNNCPYCNYFCDSATMIDDKKAIPSSGDLSFCLKCAECSIFDDNLKMIKFDLNEIKDANEYAKLIRLQLHMKQFIEENIKDE